MFGAVLRRDCEGEKVTGETFSHVWKMITKQVKATGIYRRCNADEKAYAGECELDAAPDKELDAFHKVTSPGK